MADPHDAARRRRKEQSKALQDSWAELWKTPSEDVEEEPSPKATAGSLNKFFEASFDASKDVDWEDRSRGAYSTVSKMQKSKQKATTTTEKSSELLDKLDLFLEKSRSSKRDSMSTEERSRGGYSTMSKMQKAKVERTPSNRSAGRRPERTPSGASKTSKSSATDDQHLDNFFSSAPKPKTSRGSRSVYTSMTRAKKRRPRQDGEAVELPPINKDLPSVKEELLTFLATLPKKNERSSKPRSKDLQSSPRAVSTSTRSLQVSSRSLNDSHRSLHSSQRSLQSPKGSSHRSSSRNLKSAKSHESKPKAEEKTDDGNKRGRSSRSVRGRHGRLSERMDEDPTKPARSKSRHRARSKSRPRKSLGSNSSRHRSETERRPRSENDSQRHLKVESETPRQERSSRRRSDGKELSSPSSHHKSSSRRRSGGTEASTPKGVKPESVAEHFKSSKSSKHRGRDKEHESPRGRSRRKSESGRQRSASAMQSPRGRAKTIAETSKTKILRSRSSKPAGRSRSVNPKRRSRVEEGEKETVRKAPGRTRSRSLSPVQKEDRVSPKSRYKAMLQTGTADDQPGTDGKRAALPKPMSTRRFAELNDDEQLELSPGFVASKPTVARAELMPVTPLKDSDHSSPSQTASLSPKLETAVHGHDARKMESQMASPGRMSSFAKAAGDATAKVPASQTVTPSPPKDPAPLRPANQREDTESAGGAASPKELSRSTGRHDSTPVTPRRRSSAAVSSAPEGFKLSDSLKPPAIETGVSRASSAGPTPRMSNRKEFDKSPKEPEEPPVDYHEEDVFTYYSWSLAKQDGRKILRDRKNLKDSIRHTPLYRAFLRMEAT